PMLDIVAQGAVTNATGTTPYTLHLIAAPELQVWHYRLIEGSYFVDDCLICDHPLIMEPLRGSFELVLIDNNSPVSRYILRDINAHTTSTFALRTLSGQG